MMQLGVPVGCQLGATWATPNRATSVPKMSHTVAAAHLVVAVCSKGESMLRQVCRKMSSRRAGPWRRHWCGTPE